MRNTLDANGDLVAVLGSKTTHPQFWAYATGFKYNAAGAVTSMQLGNGNWESTTFNSRLQATQIALGTTQNATNLLDLDYTYGTTSNNGNVLTQTITVPTVGTTPGFTAVQNYSYDSLNRLKLADEKPQGWTDTNCTSDPTKCWKQAFTFDRYGNRRFDEANTTMPASFANEAVTNPTISPSNNRLSSSSWSYDSSGNATADPSGRAFIYDAENKQTAVSDGSGTIGQYFYDGDGKRVKKYVPSTGETTIFVYDASGKLVAEYSTVVASTNDAKVAYLTNDHLGSARINTDANGAVTVRHDYHPFGEEMATSQRVGGLGYGGDSVRKQFTGYERDIESDLDYANARYYKPTHGRFTSTDPLLTTGRLGNPQTWNRYLYTLNNPLVFTDPTGMYECKGTEKECGKFAAGLQKANDLLTKIGNDKRYGKNSAEYKDAERALGAYGTLGDKNGVTVQFGKLDGNILGEAIGTMSGKNGTGANTVNVTIDLDKNKSGSDLLATIGHEGSHVADNQAYQGALLSATTIEAADAIMAGPLRVTHGASETRAFGISSVFAEFTLGGAASESGMMSGGGSTTFSLGGDPVKSIRVGGEDIWKSSWQKLDIETIRKNRSTAIAKGLPKSDYAPKLDKFIQ